MTRLWADSKGFTLVELLVAMVVGTLLLLVTISIVGQSSLVTRQTTSGLLATSAAAAAVDIIATDLESLANSAPGAILEMEPLSGIGSFGSYGELFLLAIPGGENVAQADRGQVRAIAYRIVDQDPIRQGGNNLTPGLYRTVISANETFSDFIGQEDLAQIFANTPPSLDDFLIGDLAGLEVRVFTGNATTPANVIGGETRPFELRRDRASLAGSPVTGPAWRWIEVSVSVFEDRDNIVDRLRNGTVPSVEKQSLLDSHTQRLTRRLALRGRF